MVNFQFNDELLELKNCVNQNFILIPLRGSNVRILEWNFFKSQNLNQFLIKCFNKLDAAC